MAKMECIEGKFTNWGGLWWHPECNYFLSEAIDLSQLRKFKGKVRLYVRKNKFYNGGKNKRPNYIFCLRDAKSDSFLTLEVKTKEPAESEERMYTRDEVERVKYGACMDGHDGYYPGDLLIEDYLEHT